MQCRILEVSRSGFYAWLKRAPSARKQQDEVLLERIKQIYDRSRGTSGAPRVLAEIKEMGILTAQKRIARLMAGAGLVGISRRRGVRTTIRGRKTATIPDLVKRDFRAESPNRLWIADIT